MPRFDVIVVGVGSMGASACAHVAQRGCRVLGLDRFGIPNTMGSHHGNSRVFRLAYFEHADYVPLLRSSRDGWLALNERCAANIYHETGGLYMGPTGCELVVSSQASAESHGIDFERLDRAALRARYPQFTLPDNYEGFYEPHAGVIESERAVAAYATIALEAGADLRGHTRVHAWRRSASGFEVETDRGKFSCDRLIVTAGVWAGKLVPTLSRSISVSRQTFAWVWPSEPSDFRLGGFPCWGIEDVDDPQSPGGLLYGFPMMEGSPGLKIARHRVADAADPDRVDRETHPADEEEWRLALQRFLPSGSGPVLSHAVCLYANTPDGHFVVGECPGEPGVFVAGGFSGHGFKFAPVVGEVLADLAISGATAHPVQFLAPQRFSSTSGRG